MEAIESVRSWRQACDDEAAEILTRAGVLRPPVDLFQVAAQLGLEVAIDAGQPIRGRIKRLRGRLSVFLQPDERPERMQWTLAHEIGEASAFRVFERLGSDPKHHPPEQREQVANQMASSLLLPQMWFADDVAAADGDLYALKEIYRTASHELLLMNLLRGAELTLATVFDHGCITRRRSNGSLPAPRLLTAERRAWQCAHAGGQQVDIAADDVRVQVWPVHEPGWKRELMRTTPLDFIAD